MDIDLNLFKKKKIDPKKSYKRRIDMVNNRKKYNNLLTDKSISVTKLDYNQAKKNNIIEINDKKSKVSENVISNSKFSKENNVKNESIVNNYSVFLQSFFPYTIKKKVIDYYDKDSNYNKYFSNRFINLFYEKYTQQSLNNNNLKKNNKYIELFLNYYKNYITNYNLVDEKKPSIKKLENIIKKINDERKETQLQKRIIEEEKYNLKLMHNNLLSENDLLLQKKILTEAKL